MIILALDICEVRGSVALLRGQQLLHQTVHDTGEEYSSWLLPAVQRTLSAAGLTMHDVELYAVARGPGLFTALRIGLTTVKAWNEVYGQHIVTVSRLHAIVSQDQKKSSVYVAACVDAGRAHLFGALYRRNPFGLELLGVEMVALPGALIQEFSEQTKNEPVAWISTDPQLLTQTNEWRARESLGEVVQHASPVLAPVIGRLGLQLAQDKRFTDVLALDAHYIRRSDADSLWKDTPGRAR